MISESWRISHVRNDVIAKLRAFAFDWAAHQPGEIVGDAFRPDRAFEPFEDELSNFGPAQITEHHLATEHDAARIHLVLVGVFRRGAVSGFEDGMAGDIIDVAAE